MRMKIRWLFICLAILGACRVFEKTSAPDNKSTTGKTTPTNGAGGASSARAVQAFDQVISATAEPELRRQLEDYKQKGIGLPLDTKAVTPDMVIKTAETYIGTPHKGGGRDRKGMDCAGLVSVALEAHGINLRGSSNSLGRFGMVINDQKDLKRGDLVFFVRTYSAKEVLTHSGIYTGNDKFIHTSSSKGVIISNFKDQSYWQPHYAFATRIFN